LLNIGLSAGHEVTSPNASKTLAAAIVVFLLQANSWTAQNTQSAIRAAAVGNIPASYATAAGSRNAQLAAGGCVNCLRWGM
jgi:hypothetical protein